MTGHEKRKITPTNAGIENRKKVTIHLVTDQPTHNHGYSTVKITNKRKIYAPVAARLIYYHVRV